MSWLSAGEFPEWKLYIQTMEVEDELKFDFDPLDASKIFPEDQFPLQPVGRMVLDRNIDNFFNEQEMVAFNPGVTPPGLLLMPGHLNTAYFRMLASPHPRCIVPHPPPSLLVLPLLGLPCKLCGGCSHYPSQGASCNYSCVCAIAFHTACAV